MSTPHTHLSAEEIDGLMRLYGLKALKHERIRKVFRIRTDQGDFALKPTRMTAESIEFIQTVLTRLARKGFPVDPFLSTREARCYVCCENTRFLLTPWFFGRETDFQRLGDLMFGAKLLARLHKETQGFGADAVPPERRLLGRWPEIFADRIRQMETFYCLSRLGQERFDRIYGRFLPYFLLRAQEVLSALWTSPYFAVVAAERAQACLCHHDFSARNVLVNQNDCRLLDFDYCVLDLRLHDLANLLLRLLRHDDWKPARARFALLVYHRQHPLTEEHLRVLYWFLRWPQDYWQIGLQYYVERLSWPMERFLKTLRRKLKDEPARQRFLEEFPRENGIAAFSVKETSQARSS